ncbi:hypothetical protein BH20ACI3_BH20ACI3_24670 [soil metagenome]
MISKFIGAKKAKHVSHEMALIEINCENTNTVICECGDDAKGNTLFDFPTEKVSFNSNTRPLGQCMKKV